MLIMICTNILAMVSSVHIDDKKKGILNFGKD